MATVGSEKGGHGYCGVLDGGDSVAEFWGGGGFFEDFIEDGIDGFGGKAGFFELVTEAGS